MLCTLLGQSPGTDHYQSYVAIQLWLNDVLNLNLTTEIKINTLIEDTTSIPPLETSTRKKPDLQIVTTRRHHVLVQIEVEPGNDKDRTIRKLTYGLVDQLCWLRNCRTNITKCSGFYFMNHSARGHVIQVVIEWEDSA